MFPTSWTIDFGKPCFVYGAIFVVPVTIFGSLLIGILIYVVLRQCKRAKKQPRNKPSDVEELSANENVVQNDEDNETVKSIVIEMPELDIINSEIPKDGATSSTERSLGQGDY